MSNNSSADTKRLAELLEEEKNIYENIRKSTEKQTELLAKDDIEAFNKSLDERAGLIEKIKGLHQESNPLMQSYVSLSAGGNNIDDEVETLKKQIRELLEICHKTNEININVMGDKTLEHSVKIDEQKAKRIGIGGYAQSVPNTSEMFDKKT